MTNRAANRFFHMVAHGGLHWALETGTPNSGRLGVCFQVFEGYRGAERMSGRDAFSTGLVFPDCAQLESLHLISRVATPNTRQIKLPR